MMERRARKKNSAYEGEKREKNTLQVQTDNEKRRNIRNNICVFITLRSERWNRSRTVCVARSFGWCLSERNKTARTAQWCDIDGDISSGMNLFPQAHMALESDSWSTVRRWNEARLSERERRGSSLIIISLFIGKRRRACQSIHSRSMEMKMGKKELQSLLSEPLYLRIYCPLNDVFNKNSFVYDLWEKRERSG